MCSNDLPMNTKEKSRYIQVIKKETSTLTKDEAKNVKVFVSALKAGRVPKS